MAKETDEEFKLTLTGFSNGSVTFIPANPGREASTEVNGNVTINTEARPATKSWFEVTFAISITQTVQDAQTSSTLMLQMPVPDEPSDAPYCDVEDAAARNIPAMLRSLAEALEADIERAANEKQDRQKP
ncbi:MAG: hypothetical protein ACPG61_10280 [Paracoccaceae bacterium]